MLPAPSPALRIALPLLGAAALAASAGAQSSYYFDFGPSDVHGAPPTGHAAAAGLSGEWNGLDTNGVAALPHTFTGLIDASGASSPVTVDLDDLGGGWDVFLYDSAFTIGGDDALLDDTVSFDASGAVTIRGLAPGGYDVYTFATSPDGEPHVTRVSVLGSNDPAQDVAGPLGTGHQLGVTFAVHNVDVAAGASVIVRLDNVQGFGSLNGLQIIPEGGTGPLGSSYCGPAVPNSSGGPAALTADGSPRAVNNDVTLTVAGLPVMTVGYFLCSRDQGFVANPAGSQGHLCLSGAIGRYSAPSQVQSSGAAGTFAFAPDLTLTPTPTGLVTVTSGETWNFQCWYRDSLLGAPTSNFTDGRSITFL